MTVIHKVVLKHAGRDCSDHGDIIEKAVAETWQDAVTLLASTGRDAGGGRAQVQADWSELARHFSMYHELFVVDPPQNDSAGYDAGLRSRIAQMNDFPPLTVPIHVEANEPARFNAYDVAEYLQDVFLIVNLAAPAALNLRTAKVTRERRGARDISRSQLRLVRERVDRLSQV